MSITPSDEQNRAINAIIDWYENRPAQQEFFLDGQAGTGKSTTAQIALQELQDRHPNMRIAQAAYTAKAALVMRSKGARNASTIHRLTYKAEHDAKGKLSWRLWANGPLRNISLLVVDEFSMLGKEMADDLRGFGKKILVLGDVTGQLPPIHGQGAFTNREPDFRLLELNRFAMEDPINEIAQKARQGHKIFPAFSHDNVKIVYLTPETSREYLYNDNTQVICGVHKVRWALTRNRRSKLGYLAPVPRVGEPIICCQNNYMIGIFNGEIEKATYVREDDFLYMKWWEEKQKEQEDANSTTAISADDFPGFDEGFGSNAIPHEKSPEPSYEIPAFEVSRHLFDEHYADQKLPEPRYNPAVTWWDFAYAITVHKAQGSEWPHVTVIDDSKSFRFSPDTPRRWLYTAVTRASEGLTLLLRK